MKKANNDICLGKKLANKTNFISKFKYFLIIPSIILVLALTIFFIFGFNKDASINNQYSMTIEFKATLDNKQFNSEKNKIETILKNNKINHYSFDKANIGNIQSKLIINLSMNDFNDDLTNSVLSDLKNDISDYVVINYSNATINDFVKFNEIHNKLVPSIALITLIFSILAFIYLWIRVEIVSAFSVLLNIIFNSILLTSFYSLFRIPVSKSTGLAFIVLLFATTIISTIIFNKIKALQYDETFKASSNKDYINETIKSKMPIVFNISILVVLFLLLTMIIAFFINSSIAFTIIGIILSLILSFIASFYFGTSIWNFIYKKSKNKRIQHHKDSVAKKEAKKNSNIKSDDEKLIV